MGQLQEPRPFPLRTALIVGTIAAVFVVIIGTVAVVVGMGGPEGPDRLPGAVTPRSSGPGAPDGLQVQTGKELERYLLGALDLPNGMAVKPGSLSSSGSFSAAAPTVPSSDRSCTGSGSNGSTEGQPLAEIEFMSPDGNLSISQTIENAPPHVVDAAVSSHLTYFKRCPEVSEKEGTEEYHTSLQVSELGSGLSGFRVHARISAQSIVGATRTADMQASYISLGNTPMLITAMAEGRELLPSDGVDDVVAKAVAKVRQGL